MRIDRDGIERLLPHRAPILLLETVQIEPCATAARASARLPGGAALLAAGDGGCFAQELSLEAAAQTLGVLLGAARDEARGGAGRRHLLLGFDEVAFGWLPPPAAELQLQVRCEQSAGDASAARFEIECDGAPVARGRLLVLGGDA